MDELLASHLLLSESEFLSEVSTNTAAIAVDIETGRIAHANGAAEQLFKCPVKNGLGTLPYEHLIPSELREKHMRHVEAYKKHPGTRAMGEGQMRLRALTLEGDSFDVAITLHAIQKVDRLYVILTFMPLPTQGAI